jgi:hypothetical protein
MEIYGSPSDEVKAVAVPFNAVYFSRFGGFKKKIEAGQSERVYCRFA